MKPFTVVRSDCADRVMYACGVNGPDEYNYSALCTGFTSANGLALTATQDNYLGINDAIQLPTGDYTFIITATAPDGTTTRTA